MFLCLSEINTPSGYFCTNVWGISNNAANYQVFGNPDAGDNLGNQDGKAAISMTLVDGASSTVLVAERYGWCRKSLRVAATDMPSGYEWLGISPYGSVWSTGSMRAHYQSMLAYGNRVGTKDYTSQGDGPGSLWGHFLGKVGPNSRFQVAPTPFNTKCDYALAQTLHTEGMQLSMADGSVRSVSGSISGVTWWLVVTPNGGETQTSEW